ncbi:DUF72 domain-containing protein [Ramlibacter sp. G-1-2-2]|uniref:DUF72 domain-containing protein n=1 Tax=Ramlibacter agri TaxID=2728837 RepID=A0A848HJ07_9BURK|nr:DUF72 domain-containing protein [Ramlibacter agri]NML48493.1 DUF72 domain-containing protein [Ramlibacter agri]
MIRSGCAGWALPRAVREEFGPGDSQLARYATRLPAVEINTSFYRPHQRKVYERWAASVPADFRFSAKLPKAITHERRFVDCEALLDTFLAEVTGLGEKLGWLLVQLPPSFAFESAVALPFLELLSERFDGNIACEPRHASWFGYNVDALLRELRIARVLADPVRIDEARAPGGWTARVYLRLHGSPRMYFSPYEPELLQALAARLRLADRECEEAWCIFDNTGSGAAAANALELQRLTPGASRRTPASAPGPAAPKPDRTSRAGRS